jgi:hypothetical protein
MQIYELSSAALGALNEMCEDYGFTDGPQFLDDVLDVLKQLADLTPEERQLRRELEAMPAVARESISRAIRAARAKTSAV